MVNVLFNRYSLRYSLASPTPTSGNNNKFPFRSYFDSTLIVGMNRPMSRRFLTKSILKAYNYSITRLLKLNAWNKFSNQFSEFYLINNIFECCTNVHLL